MPTPNPREQLLARWLKSPFTYEQLRDKKVSAHFVTRSGEGYEGVGEIRVRRNPQGLLSIDLVFTRHDSPDLHTDMLFNLSSRQLPHLRKAPTDADHDFVYEGLLAPDNQPEVPPKV